MKIETKGKRKSRIDSEARVLDAAIVLFSKLGFETTTLKAISEQAKVNEALIIRYFGSKDELLTTVIVGHLRTEISSYEDTARATSVAGEIENYLRTWLHSELRNRDFLRVATARAAVDPKIRREVQKHVPLQGHPELNARLKELQKAGQFPKSVSTELLTHTIGLQGLGTSFLVNLLPAVDIKATEISIAIFASLIADGLNSCPD